MMNSERRRYIVKLREVSGFLQRLGSINIMGMVVEFSIPRKSQGTDYCTILKIIDHSQQNPELCVNVFMRDMDKLPQPRRQKDIILLCNVKVEIYKQNLYAVCNERSSSFALFEGRVSDDFNPYQVSSTFQPAESDKDFIRQLRNWSQTTRFDAGISEHVVPLKDIKEDFIDLVCQVLYVCEVSGKWMLFVWDGTDTPSLGLDARDEEQNPLPLHIELDPLPKDVLLEFPHVGTVLRVVADKSYDDLGGSIRLRKSWVRIRNLLLKTDSGLWKGILTRSTKIRPLAENDKSVTDRLRDCDERIKRLGRQPSLSINMSNLLTEVPNNEGVHFATLMDLLTTTQASGGFKCVIRMITVCPSQAKDFQSPNGNYRMRITLEDPTARIHALLAAEEADNFFGGHLPLDIVATKMNKLLGVSESENSPRNPPWTICCIGFHSSDQSDILGSRHYHICNTKLII